MPILDYIAILVVAVSIFLLFERKRTTYHVGVLGFASVIIGVSLLSFSTNFDLQRNLLFVTGYLAFFYLGTSLIISPLLRITKKSIFAKLMPYRRDIGVLSFVFALSHVLLTFTKVFNWSPGALFSYYLNSGPIGISIYAGTIAIFGLLILSLTANNKALRKYGSNNWKNIQRFSYAIIILALVHIVNFGRLLNQFVILQILFFGVTLGVILIQVAGFLKTKGYLGKK